MFALISPGANWQWRRRRTSSHHDTAFMEKAFIMIHSYSSQQNMVYHVLGGVTSTILDPGIEKKTMEFNTP